jgi:hypothetical protein
LQTDNAKLIAHVVTCFCPDLRKVPLCVPGCDFLEKRHRELLSGEAPTPPAARLHRHFLGEARPERLSDDEHLFEDEDEEEDDDLFAVTMDEARKNLSPPMTASSAYSPLLSQDELEQQRLTRKRVFAAASGPPNGAKREIIG